MTRQNENLLAFTSMRLFLLSMVMLACLLTTAASAKAQFLQLSIADYYYGSNYMGMSGDTMKFQFTLGIAEDPADDVAGLNVLFTYPRLKAAPTATLVRVAGTWVAAGLQNPVPSSVVYDDAFKQLKVMYLRENGNGVTGSGTVLNIALVRPGGFSRTEAAMYLDGGIVMVDNINLRIAHNGSNSHQGINQSSANTMVTEPMENEIQLAAQASLQVSPNPATDYVDVTVADPQGCILKLWSMQAQLLLEQACQSSQRLDLSYLPVGTYLLAVESATRKEQQLIVKR